MKVLEIIKFYQIPTQLVALVWLFFLMLQWSDLDYSLLFIGFLVFFSSYFYIAKRSIAPKGTIFLLVFSVVCIGVILFCLKKYVLIPKLAWVAFLGFMYNSSVFCVSIRQISYLKSFWIALVWTLTLVFLSNCDLVLVAVGVYFHILGISLLFDFQDVAVDTQKTFANMLGLSKTKTIAIVAFLLSLGFFYFSLNFVCFLAYLPGFLILIGVVLSLNLEKKPCFYFYILEFANVFGIASIFFYKICVNLLFYKSQLCI